MHILDFNVFLMQKKFVNQKNLTKTKKNKSSYKEIFTEIDSN